GVVIVTCEKQNLSSLVFPGPRHAPGEWNLAGFTRVECVRSLSDHPHALVSAPGVGHPDFDVVALIVLVAICDAECDSNVLTNDRGTREFFSAPGIAQHVELRRSVGGR